LHEFVDGQPHPVVDAAASRAREPHRDRA
jgi:hypothetical protein